MRTHTRVDAYTLLHINVWFLILLILSYVRVPILMNGTVNWSSLHPETQTGEAWACLMYRGSCYIPVRVWDFLWVPISFMGWEIYTGQRHCVDCVDRICFFARSQLFIKVFARNTPVGLKLKHQPIPARNFPPTHRLYLPCRCWFVVSGDAKKVGWRTDGRVGCFKSSFLWLVGWIYLFQGYCRDACASCLQFFVGVFCWCSNKKKCVSGILCQACMNHFKTFLDLFLGFVCWWGLFSVGFSLHYTPGLVVIRHRQSSWFPPRRDIQKQIPFAIIRPSGVVSAASEPLPGWVDAYLLVEPLIDPGNTNSEKKTGRWNGIAVFVGQILVYQW